MRRLNNVYLIIILITGLTACSNTTATNSSSVKIASSTPLTNTETISETPTETAKNFLEAVRQRNYGIVRERLSQQSITNMQQAATDSKTNMDQVLKRIIDQDAQEMAANNVVAFEFRNEVITNNYASLEAKARNADHYARISLSKENNQWKINIDQTSPSE